MGLTHVHMEISNPSDMETTEPIELLVDSGAIYSVIPAVYWGSWESGLTPSKSSVWLTGLGLYARRAWPGSGMAIGPAVRT